MPKGVYQRSAGADLSKRLAAIKTAQTAPLREAASA